MCRIFHFDINKRESFGLEIIAEKGIEDAVDLIVDPSVIN